MRKSNVYNNIYINKYITLVGFGIFGKNATYNAMVIYMKNIILKLHQHMDNDGATT